MPDIEIKRGYEVLPDNNVKFGIRVTNNSDNAISDVEVFLDYTETLFEISGGKVKKLGNIPPSVPRTAQFIMKPLGCVHKENIGATIVYKDHKWTKHTLEMRTKEIHCVCPFLKEKPMKRADFLSLSNSGYKEERGINFDGISVDKLTEFIAHTCKNRLYKVDEFQIGNGKILYLTGDAVGEKAYYLLTVVIKESEGIVQVFLRASSDKSHGLSGFLNEIMDNLRHLVMNTSAKEIGIIKKEYVVNIIDSIVKDSNISVKEAEPQIKAQSIQSPQADKVYEVRPKREETQNLRNVQKQKEGTSYTKFFAVAILLGIMALGYLGFANFAGDSPQPVRPTPLPTPTIIQTPTPSPTVTPIKIQDVKPTTQSKSAQIKPKPPASVELHGEKTDVVLGEDIILKLLAINIIKKPIMKVQVILIPPSGMSVTSSEFVTSGAGQYTTTYELKPGEGKDIEVRIKTNQVGNFDVKGTAIYYYGEDKATAEEIDLKLPIIVRAIS